MDQNEKLSLLAQLIRLARTDHEIRDNEFIFLKKIAEILAIDEATFKSLFEENIELSPPALETERILQFHRLVLLANCDLQVSQGEMEFLRQAGMRLGLHPEAVESVLTEMEKVKWGMLDPEKLICIFQVYHN